MRIKSGFTLTELLFVATIFIIIITIVISTSIMLQDVCYKSIVGHELQRSVNLIMGYIIKHAPGETSCNGLRSAKSYDIPAVTPAGSEIDFVDTHAITRKYYLQNNSVMYYESSDSGPQTILTIFAAQPNMNVNLLFSQASADSEMVSIYLSISQTIRGMTISRSLSTYVNIRNIPK